MPLIWLTLLLMFHVVDDTDSIREAVKTMLERQGFETISFGHPKDYINFVCSPEFRDPVAVFTDVTMPDMNGYELMDIVSRLKPELKFVVMTAEPEIKSEHANRACMYLDKPFRMGDMIKVVESLVRCHAFSPADDHGCDNIDDRHLFPIKNWSCPHSCKDCAHA